MGRTLTPGEFVPAGAIEDLREGPGPGVPVVRADGIRDARMEGGLAVITA